MRKSLVIHEINHAGSKKVAKIFSLISGASKIVDMEHIPKNMGSYDNIVLILGCGKTSINSKIKEYLNIDKEKIISKRIAVIGVGISAKGLGEYVNSLCSEIGKKVDVIQRVQSEPFNLTEVCIIASKCSEVFNKPILNLYKEELIKEIDEFIFQHNTCALATGSGEFNRCTPIEYTYLKGIFYFITEGGLKFRGILLNPSVSISIFNEYKDMQNLKGLQISGKAEIIENYSDEYNEFMEVKGIEINRLKSMPISLNLIRVKVDKFEFLNSDFAKKGLDVKQILRNNNKGSF
jgi:nitroimidazol reductase NimA-like FMN-containing flavoprotein (pyridoxamine 5'-phosphate oxidase superfamily)